LNTNFKLELPFLNRLGSGRTSPSRGRRYSVSGMMNQSPNLSSTLLNQIGSGKLSKHRLLFSAQLFDLLTNLCFLIYLKQPTFFAKLKYKK